VADLLRVEGDAHGLGVAGHAAGDLLVGGSRDGAAHVAGLDVDDAGELLEEVLDAPEAAAGEVAVLGGGGRRLLVVGLGAAAGGGGGGRADGGASGEGGHGGRRGYAERRGEVTRGAWRGQPPAPPPTPSLWPVRARRS